MPLYQLTSEECEVIRRCLRAAAVGPFFEDLEFHTLFGLQRRELAAVLSQWPHVDDRLEDVDLAINNSLCNLLWHPHGHAGALYEWVGASADEIERIFEKWRGEDRVAPDPRAALDQRGTDPVLGS